MISIPCYIHSSQSENDLQNVLDRHITWVILFLMFTHRYIRADIDNLIEIKKSIYRLISVRFKYILVLLFIITLFRLLCTSAFIRCLYIRLTFRYYRSEPFIFVTGKIVLVLLHMPTDITTSSYLVLLTLLPRSPSIDYPGQGLNCH